MSKKSSPEARVIEFFEAASLATAELVLGIVRSRLKTRAAQPRPGDPSPVAKVVRRKRRTRAEIQAANTTSARTAITPTKATSFDPAELVKQ